MTEEIGSLIGDGKASVMHRGFFGKTKTIFGEITQSGGSEYHGTSSVVIDREDGPAPIRALRRLIKMNEYYIRIK